MFILIMQFFWVYIDDLMGKGLSIWVILELLFYVSASLIPLALPLAILLSSLMTFGNMSENNELTALKSNGFSLLKIMRPLTVVVLLLSGFTFYFANYVIPVANLKWHSLIYDIQNTKLSSLIVPGVYTTEIDGYAIKINKGKDSSFNNITIHDHTEPNVLKTVKAKQARIYRSTSGNYLFFDLKNGAIYEELELENGEIGPNGMPLLGKISSHPDRISTFERATYKMNVTGISLKRSDEDIFQDKYEMMNVFQIGRATDSLKRRRNGLDSTFLASIKGSFASFHVINNQLKTMPITDPSLKDPPVIYRTYKSLKRSERKELIPDVLTKLYQINENVRNQSTFMETLNHEEDQFWIEFHRKFALTYAIIVLFFVGAPLGALVKKGGFGAPVVIAAFIFMVYFIILSIGDNLADTYVIAPWLGMWLSGLFFTPIAMLVTYTANNDVPIASIETWKMWTKRMIRRG
jgi:lipopolysaccharide export system permease protein